MDMKKILQAMDGISTKPVEGADSMARFLRVVRESEINQAEAVGDFGADPKSQAQMYLQFHTGMMDPSTLPAFMAITPGVSLAVQPPIGTTGSHEEVLASLSAANKRLPKDLQVSWDELKDIGGVSDTIKLTGEPHPDTYNPTTDPVKEGLVDGSGNPVLSGSGQPIQTGQPAAVPAPAQPQIDPANYKVPSIEFLQKNYKHPADIINGAHPSEADTTRIGAWAGGSDFDELMMALNGSYYQARKANPNFEQPAFVKDDWELVQRMLGTPEGKEYAIDHSIGLANIDDKSPDAVFNRAQHDEFKKQSNAKILAQKSDVIKPGWKYDQELGMTPAQAELQAQKAKQQPAVPVQENSLSKFLSIVRKNDVSILKEGAGPHRVALPVQMAMQHYQQPTPKTQPRERLIDKYFVEAETNLTQRKEEKRAVYNQYAKTIANRVLMKEGAEGFNTAYLEKAAESNRVGRYMISIADARAELARRVGSQDPHTEPPTKPIPTGPTGYSKEYLQKAADPKRFGRYLISVEKAQELLKQMNEAPIAMDPAEPNNPTIHNHQKANTMTLKGRIASARAQLKELAQLADSDSLLAWEEICKKAKGGMFMGLEQNLEQIRHGISELAAKRRKGGVASRGIDKHIGEGKRK